jgi:transcriptional regulator with XRE-family HTH domain
MEVRVTSSIIHAPVQHQDLNAASSLKAILGLTIKRERESLGISQDELAKRSGLHRTYVSALERGARNPSIGSVEKIAQALRVSVAKLFEDQAGNDRTKEATELGQ